MDRLMRVRFAAPADGWIGFLSRSCSASIELLGAKQIENRRGKREIGHLVEISTDHTPQEVSTSLWQAPGITGVVVTEASCGFILAIVMSTGCRVCETLADPASMSFMSSARMQDEDTMVYQVIASRSGLDFIAGELLKRDTPYALLGTSSFKVACVVTSKQQKILQLALETGFYDYPRKVTREKLAEKLGLSASDFNEVLRRAERRVVSQYAPRLVSRLVSHTPSDEEHLDLVEFASRSRSAARRPLELKQDVVNDV